MSGPLILLVGAIYIGIGIDLLRKGEIGLAITFLAYAVANVGMFIAARGA